MERSFQELTEQLRCEVDTLGYPKAALLGFSLAVCAYNLLAVLKGALAAARGAEEVERELSAHAVAQEVSQDSSGLDVAVPAAWWQRFARMTAAELAAWLKGVAGRLAWRAYRKAGRPAKKAATAPKSGAPPRKGSRRRTHVSTARLLQERQKK